MGPSEKQQPCAEKVRLTHVFMTAALEYSRIANLLMSTRVMEPAEFREAGWLADEAERRAEEARAALHAHVAEHGC